MGLFKYSRYRREKTFQAQSAEGDWHLFVGIRATTTDAPASAFTHTVEEGENYQAIAERFLGDPALWWILADMNVDTVFYPLDLAAGDEVRVPSKTWAMMKA